VNLSLITYYYVRILVQFHTYGLLIRRRLAEIEQAGAQEIIVWMPDAKDLEPIKLFAQECLQK